LIIKAVTKKSILFSRDQILKNNMLIQKTVIYLKNIQN